MPAPDLSPGVALPRWGWPAALLGGAVAAVVWLADLAGPLAAVDGLTYDAFLRGAASWSAPPPAVLLVECPPDFGRDGSSRPRQALETLRRLGASQVIFTAVP